MNKPLTVFRVGDVVQTPSGVRGQIVAFVDGRADVRFYRDSGALSTDDANGVLLWPRLLKFTVLSHKGKV